MFCALNLSGYYLVTFRLAKSCETYSLSCDRVKLSKIVCHTTKSCELRGDGQGRFVLSGAAILPVKKPYCLSNGQIIFERWTIGLYNVSRQLHMRTQ